MSAAKRAKQLGAKNLKVISEVANKHVTTLSRWHDTNPALFDAIVLGALIMENQTPDDAAAMVQYSNKINALKLLTISGGGK
tara:strand:- start:160 stop:405 length:246 start_codon:yes stop_codon:yes gene_type:complete